MEETENQAKVQDSSQQQTSQQNVAESGPPSAEGKSKKKWVIIAIVIIAVLAIGGFLILRTPDFDAEEEPSPTPELEVVPTPVSTPTPEPADKSEISILILNGTGIAGEAGLLQTQLEDMGFVIIEVDNADSADNEVTMIVFASNIPQSLQEELVDGLSDMYQEISATTSSKLGDNEIEITTGLRSGQTSKPTSTPTTEPEDEETEPTPTDTASPTPTPTSAE